jgi:hypothetical protein
MCECVPDWSIKFQFFFFRRMLIIWWPRFGFLHCVVVKYFRLSGKHIASPSSRCRQCVAPKRRHIYHYTVHNPKNHHNRVNWISLIDDLLWIRHWRKMLWPAWKLSACQEEFCCLDLADWFYVAVKCGAHCMNEEALVTLLWVRGSNGIVQTAWW